MGPWVMRNGKRYNRTFCPISTGLAQQADSSGRDPSRHGMTRLGRRCPPATGLMKNAEVFESLQRL